jgi:hypothetical protein
MEGSLFKASPCKKVSYSHLSKTTTTTKELSVVVQAYNSSYKIGIGRKTTV